MKLYPNELNKVTHLININNIKAILLYGLEANLINDYVVNLSKTLNYIVRNIDYFDLINLDDFYIVFSNLNLFSKREIIKISATPSSIHKNLEKFLAEKTVFNFPVFIAKEATSTSSVVKFFMLNKELATVAFYEQGFNNTSSIIQDLKPKKVTQSAIDAIKDMMSCNPNLLKQEIEKIKLLTHEKDCITGEDIIKLPTYLSKQNLDATCRSLITKDAKQYFQLILELVQNYTPTILIIRSIEKYYLNLYIVLKSGKNTKDAAQSLKPPIFFKNFNHFLEIANKITVNKVTTALNVLYAFEKLLKSSQIADKALLEKLYFDINYQTK